ncbi:MAG: hypothetical protein M1832_005877 [Thelocarpon impressellum]|nr:MAG: hypothetical protein M1832_005877 [Thelocarpon impressellum]
MTAPALADLIFPPAPSLSDTLASVRRSALSIPNRLRSIHHDAAFVAAVADAYALPPLANERCGGWYVPPERRKGGCYFKSTDGHAGEWAVSLSRLNLGVLEVVREAGGCIVVDSTRRGKSMPDALSKTVPLWCAAINALLFPDTPAHHILHTPPQAVSPSEHAQMAARVPASSAALRALSLRLPPLSRPLRPLWVTPDSPLPPSPPTFDAFHPVVCVTASRRVRGAEASEGGYIQGAGDDSEAWARGLTPEVFWAHRPALLGAPEAEVEALIASLAARPVPSGLTPAPAVPIRPTTTLFLSSSPLPGHATVLAPSLPAGKLGSRALRAYLQTLPSVLTAPLSSPVLVAVADVADHGVGIALAVLCLWYDEGGEPMGVALRPGDGRLDKGFVKRRLAWLGNIDPANGKGPSRATLLAVHSFVLSPVARRGSDASREFSTSIRPTDGCVQRNTH